jgi:RNA polymerase sigma-70 factor (ECF subfamily)
MTRYGSPSGRLISWTVAEMTFESPETIEFRAHLAEESSQSRMRSAEERLKTKDIPEEEAIRLAQQGDAAAFEQLYRRHSARVYALCLRIVQNEGDAEDLTQEAFLLLFRKIHTFRGEAKFSTWLHRLATNLSLMRLRKRKHPEVSLDAVLEPGEDESGPRFEPGVADLRLSGVVDHVNLSRAIEQLPEGYKKMFILHDVQGYEHHEIAKILGCSSGNSKSQLYKARLRLRDLLQESFRNRAREKRQSARESAASEDHDHELQCAKA